MAKGRQKKLRNGLTPKENAFKNKVLEQIAETGTINGTQAALETYDTNDKNTANQIALQNLQKPTIKEQVEAALESNGLSIDKIAGNIGKLANFEPTKVSADVILRSNESLLKLIGAYPDKKSMHLSLNLKGKIGSMGFEEAKEMYDTMNAEVGELVSDSQ